MFEICLILVSWFLSLFICGSIFPMDIALFGIQGSGKGTQAKRLAKDFNFDIFEAGGELRKIAASGSELGNTVKTYIDAGNLVPHEIIMQVVKEAILARPKDQKILFDGIPRDSDQKRDFDAIMKDTGREFMGIEILLDEKTAKERILGRAKLEGRKDDADTRIIEKRMKTFTEKTKPVIDEYKRINKIIEIDGNKDPDAVFQALKIRIQLLNQ